MNLTISEYDFDKSEPFREDLLGRKDFATILTNIVEASDGQLILAINGGWGSGKTTFIKQWQSLLQRDSYQTVYINAWEHDYVADPFLPIISAILSQVNLSEGKIYDVSEGLRKCGKIIMSSLSGFVATYLGEKAIRTIQQECQNSLDYSILDDFQEYAQELSQFKEALGAYAKELQSVTSKKLVIFVDELDRCKPNYAIEMLERIKHLFYVPNVVFVLSLNNKVMEESVRGFYGCGDVNAADYLRRFYDIAVTLPEPKEINGFVEYLFERYGINAYLKKHYSNEVNNIKNDLFLGCVQSISYAKNSLRDIERFFAMLRLLLCSINVKSVSVYTLYAYLYCFMFDKPLYDNIKYHRLSLQQLGNKLKSIFMAKSPSDINASESTIVFIISILIEYARSLSRFNEAQRQQDQQEILQFLQNHFSLNASWCEQYVGNAWYSMRGDSKLFERIELVESLGNFD